MSQAAGLESAFISAGISALMSLSQPASANSGNQMSSTSMMSNGDWPAAMPVAILSWSAS